MPGPKMGPRPADFCEELVRQSPTFQKWESLPKGEKLRYACRDFIKGQPQDEERLMRRIMIARRNNLRDHAILKRARKKQDGTPVDAAEVAPTVAPKSGSPSATSGRKRRPASTFSDSQVAKEMDVAAVEATRSYRAWMALKDGEEFVYNQKYYKGRPNQDWLLRKNIWRRMRYRRENKKLVTQLREDDPSITVPRNQPTQQSASEIVDQALTSGTEQQEGTPQPGTSEGGASSSETPGLTAGDTSTEEHPSAGSKRAVKAEEGLENGKPPKAPRIEPTELSPAAAATANSFPLVQNPVPSDEMPLSLAASQDVPGLDLQHTQPTQLPAQGTQPAMDAHSHHPDETTHAALTAAAAATASGADDLVELSAVEAAVAAAANYVASQEDSQEDDEDDDDHVLDTGHHHHHHTTSVHNPLEAAANAAALDSAAKLAAAASQQVTDEEAAALDAAEDVVISV